MELHFETFSPERYDHLPKVLNLKYLSLVYMPVFPHCIHVEFQHNHSFDIHRFLHLHDVPNENE